jgi:hypothetical protein
MAKYLYSAGFGMRAIGVLSCTKVLLPLPFEQNTPDIINPIQRNASRPPTNHP